MRGRPGPPFESRGAAAGWCARCCGALVAALLGLSPSACKTRELLLERAGGVVAAMPEGRSRIVSVETTDGVLEHEEPGKWRTRLVWEPDPRQGPPSDEEALQAAALEHGELVRGARALRELTQAPGESGEGAGVRAVDGHPAALVHSASADALVWRCEKSGRMFVLLREGDPGFTLDELAAQVRCHDLRTKPANAQVPAASLVALGEGWTLSRRTPASAVYLRGDALLELFAGRKTEPTDDLVLAAHLAPAWIEAAGLSEPHVETGERTNGPEGHPAIALRGEARLDGRPVRFSYLEWRCLQRARTYGALVVSEPPAADAGAANGWTGHDDALLAVRCHG